MYVYTTYRLNVSKMDGAGFVPLFQQQLSLHISKLAQPILDKCSESELMAMLEKDVAALNDVIASWFDLVASSLELLILIPVLFILSPEMSLLVVVVIPPFFWLRARMLLPTRDCRTTAAAPTSSLSHTPR